MFLQNIPLRTLSKYFGTKLANTFDVSIAISEGFKMQQLPPLIAEANGNSANCNG